MDDYFGLCPLCGRKDGYLNNLRDHWMICKKHKTKWCVGSNLFSSWRDMSGEEQDSQRKELTEFTEVEPWYPSLKGQLFDACHWFLHRACRPLVSYTNAIYGSSPSGCDT